RIRAARRCTVFVRRKEAALGRIIGARAQLVGPCPGVLAPVAGPERVRRVPACVGRHRLVARGDRQRGFLRPEGVISCVHAGDVALPKTALMFPEPSGTTYCTDAPLPANIRPACLPVGVTA